MVGTVAASAQESFWLGRPPRAGAPRARTLGALACLIQRPRENAATCHGTPRNVRERSARAPSRSMRHPAVFAFGSGGSELRSHGPQQYSAPSHLHSVASFPSADGLLLGKVARVLVSRRSPGHGHIHHLVSVMPEARRLWCLSRSARCMQGEAPSKAPATAELPLGARHATSCIQFQSCKGSAPQSLASLRDPRLSGTKLCGAFPSGQSETIPQKPTCACGYS